MAAHGIDYALPVGMSAEGRVTFSGHDRDADTECDAFSARVTLFRRRVTLAFV